MLKICILILLSIFIFSTNIFAIDRCVELIPDVRTQLVKQFGFDFPYWWGIGVAKQESACRADIVSFDGGIGLYQFTPSTGIVKSMKGQFGEGFDPSNPDHSIKAFAYYLRTLYDGMSKSSVNFRSKVIHPKIYSDKCGKLMSAILMQYNGGWWFVLEWEKSGQDCDRTVIRTFCTRGGVQLKNRYLSFCEVNYSYPTQVYKYSQNYRYGKPENAKWRFW